MGAIRMGFKVQNTHLLNAMKSLGLNNNQFAEYLGINPCTLSCFMNLDYKRMNKDNTKIIANKLQTTCEKVNPRWALPFTEALKKSSIRLEDDVVAKMIRERTPLQIPASLTKKDWEPRLEKLFEGMEEREVYILRSFLGIGTRQMSALEIGEQINLHPKYVMKVFNKAVDKLNDHGMNSVGWKKGVGTKNPTSLL